MEFSTPFRFDGFVAKSPFFTTENQLTEVWGSGGGSRSRAYGLNLLLSCVRREADSRWTGEDVHNKLS